VGRWLRGTWAGRRRQILRQGMGAEGLAWTVVFTLSPLSCIYYPVSTLPGWLQHAAWALPSTYVFEGMRTVLFTGVFRSDYFLTWYFMRQC